MKLTKLSGLLGAAVIVSAPYTFAAGIARVTNSNDDGPGSLRYAIEEANASRVVIGPGVGDIEIDSTIVYDGTIGLHIAGSGQTAYTSENVTLLEVANGADLSISNLNFQGPGGYSIFARGDESGPAGKGIFVRIPLEQTGTVRLDLKDVSVSDVANHGIHISDCTIGDDCGGGSGGGGDGSAASIQAHLTNVTIADVGQGRFDADGFRADERGPGSIYFFADNLTATGVGADGTELDEGNDGGINAIIRNSAFNVNGDYCDPAILSAYMPEEDEGEFDPPGLPVGDLPEEILDLLEEGDLSPDDRCFEIEIDFYDDAETMVEAYEIAIDVDDGIDFDEAGDGTLKASFHDSEINDNYDEGVDFDEAGAGSIEVHFSNTAALRNTDDGFKHSEEDDGSVKGTVIASTAEDNGGKGFVFEEEGDGNLSVKVNWTSTDGNDDGDDTGIEVVQEDDGTGRLVVVNSSIADGIDDDGVDVIER